MRNTAKPRQRGDNDGIRRRLIAALQVLLRRLIDSVFRRARALSREEESYRRSNRHGDDNRTAGNRGHSRETHGAIQVYGAEKSDTEQEGGAVVGPAGAGSGTVQASEENERLRLYDPDNDDSYITSDVYESVEP